MKLVGGFIRSCFPCDTNKIVYIGLFIWHHTAMSFVYVLLAAPGGFGPLPSNYMLVIQN